MSGVDQISASAAAGYAGVSHCVASGQAFQEIVQKPGNDDHSNEPSLNRFASEPSEACASCVVHGPAAFPDLSFNDPSSTDRSELPAEPG